jgi:hypothetical protein
MLHWCTRILPLVRGRPARRSWPTRPRSRPAVEILEDRRLPALLAPAVPLAFDAATGVLAITGASARVATDAGGVAVTLNGQRHSADAADPYYDPALAGATAAALRGVRLSGAADTLTLGDVRAAALWAYADGGIAVTGTVPALR